MGGLGRSPYLISCSKSPTKFARKVQQCPPNFRKILGVSDSPRIRLRPAEDTSSSHCVTFSHQESNISREQETICTLSLPRLRCAPCFLAPHALPTISGSVTLKIPHCCLARRMVRILIRIHPVWFNPGGH